MLPQNLETKQHCVEDKSCSSVPNLVKIIRLLFYKLCFQAPGCVQTLK